MLASPDQQISLTDPDSRSMATSGRGSGVVGYNVQVAVDTEHHLIVTHEVTNTGSDRSQLAKIASQAKAVLGADELAVVADRGYFNSSEILACAQADITVTLPKPMISEDLSTATAPLPPGTFTTSAHSDEWKIANALSAGSASITGHAAVIDWPANPKEGMSHGRMLRQGTNGWTCMPDVPGRPQHDPMCVDETMMKWLMATLAGKKPDIDRVGLSYMLLGEARQGQNAAPAKDPTQIKEWFYIGPHVMVVLPDSVKEALRGINQDLSNNEPYVTLINSAAGSTPLWVIPVAKSRERIKEEPPK